MTNKTIHVAFFSPCGGTKKVMEALTAELGDSVIFHNRTLPENRDQDLNFGENDFVIFGAPVYGGRIPRRPDQIFGNIRGANTPCGLVAVYGNRAFEGALIDLDALARANGFIPVAAVAAVAQHSMAPIVATNRPDEQDRLKLASFGKEIMRQLEKGASLAQAPGAMPEWQIPEGVSMLPFADLKICKKCGACVKVCPSGAIPADQPWTSVADLCSHCAACVQICKPNARRMGNDAAQEMAKQHLAICLEKRREPELFV